MIIPKNGITANRKTSEKIKFIIDNYYSLNKVQIAEEINEPVRWVKRQISLLLANKTLNYKISRPKKILFEIDWKEEIKQYAFDLRRKYLKTNIYITKALKNKFDFDVNPPSLQFWLDKFECYGRSKQDWMIEFLTKELMEDLLNKSYKMTDISSYVKDNFDVYISDDLILIHIQKLGLLSQKLKKINDIKKKSEKFSKEWLTQKINEHFGIRGISEEMGFSKTIVMKRIKEEGLFLIKHRKIWSKDMDCVRTALFNAPYLEIPPEDLHQMILGWLIGDGHLDFNGRFVINHSLQQTSYIYLKIRVLKKFLSNIVTVPIKASDKYYGGKEQFGISCPGFISYTKYLNADGSKNYEKIISELNPLGLACYFMDDGSYVNNTVISMNKKLIKNFENKYSFGIADQIKGLIEVKNINPDYFIPHFYYKIGSIGEIGAYWKNKVPELFNPTIINDLDLSFVDEYTIKNNKLLLNDVIAYYKKRGFPYLSISDEYLRKEFELLSLLKTEYFWKEEKVLKYITTGNYIFKHFMPHMVEAKYRNISPLETFNNYSLFYKTLEYSVKKKRTILPVFVHDDLIHFNGGVVGFPCTVAKAIVDRFTKEGDVIVDPCAGWGGRLLGTSSMSNRYYTGFEPWNKTSESLNKIIDFFGLSKAFIINSVFDMEKAPKRCSLVFTSPPYIDLEVYGTSMNLEEWKELIVNIIRYSEKALISGGYLILNLPENLRYVLPPITLKEETSLYWFTSTRKKDVNKAEILYIWSK